jgi:hypothetical protein
MSAVGLDVTLHGPPVHSMEDMCEADLPSRTHCNLLPLIIDDLVINGDRETYFKVLQCHLNFG